MKKFASCIIPVFLLFFSIIFTGCQSSGDSDTASTNADLSSLSLSAGTLTPEFSAEYTYYLATVGNEVSTITITPEADDSGASIKVNNIPVESGKASGSISLGVGYNSIYIDVTAEDGTTSKRYCVNVKRSESKNALLSELKLSGINLNPVFSPSVTSYTATVVYGLTSTYVQPVTADSNAFFKINNSFSSTIILNVGVNVINITVTAADGLTTINYKVTVKRLSESDPLTAESIGGEWGDSNFVLVDSGDDGIMSTDDDIWSRHYLTITDSTLTYTAELSIGLLGNLTLIDRFQYSYSFTLGNAVTTPEGATEIDMTQQSCTYTIYHPDFVTYANNSALYQNTDWEAGQTRNVAGRTDLDGMTEGINGEVWYNVIKNTGVTLYLGNDTINPEYDGSTAEKRPQILDGGWGSF